MSRRSSEPGVVKVVTSMLRWSPASQELWKESVPRSSWKSGDPIGRAYMWATLPPPAGTAAAVTKRPSRVIEEPRSFQPPGRAIERTRSS